MKSLRYFLFILPCILATGISFSQPVEKNQVSRYYFRNPLDLPLQLAANFGELRPNHWHMGLDIRTNQKENALVYAAATGYIAEIGIRPQSFGRFLIINHPNGLSTLYAHLNDFFPALENYVTAEQYKKESWALELKLSSDKFPVTKGQFIAYSGNTGGSQGPHLHFEILETATGKRLNPLKFEFGLKDNIAPTLGKLAIYDRGRSILEQTPEYYYTKKTDSGYIIRGFPLIKTGLRKLSFAIQATDTYTGSNNPNGIFSASVYLDEELKSHFRIDSISYEETAYMNAHIDFRERYNGGAFIQHLSSLPGDKAAVYPLHGSDAIIQLNDTAEHIVRIEVSDVHQNRSELRFFLKYSDSMAREQPFHSHPHFSPNQENALLKPDFEIYFSSQSLYDTIAPAYYRNNLVLANAISPAHQVNDASIPIHDELKVRIKPDKYIPAGLREKVLMQRTYRGSNQVRLVKWEDDKGSEAKWASAGFSDLGTFQLFLDSIPPDLDDLGKGDTVDLSPASRIIFTPTDNFGSIRSFRAELNGNWLRFTNDKSRNWIYQFDDRCPFGVHHLKVTVRDLAGNETVRSWYFKRGPYTAPKKKPVRKPVKKKTSSRKTSQKKK